mmetsp:Transcript_9376/g.19366  ORF Transcript_9376/g.19366 Transcript_9376/m.19366 type:complete len:292 (-) Transcript_9376:760-1635(-)
MRHARHLRLRLRVHQQPGLQPALPAHAADGLPVHRHAARHQRGRRRRHAHQVHSVAAAAGEHRCAQAWGHPQGGVRERGRGGHPGPPAAQDRAGVARGGHRRGPAAATGLAGDTDGALQRALRAGGVRGAGGLRPAGRGLRALRGPPVPPPPRLRPPPLPPPPDERGGVPPGRARVLPEPVRRTGAGGAATFHLPGAVLLQDARRGGLPPPLPLARRPHHLREPDFPDGHLHLHHRVLRPQRPPGAALPAAPEQQAAPGGERAQGGARHHAPPALHQGGGGLGGALRGEVA